MLIDTHAHLNFPHYDGDRDDVIRRALEAGISMINVGCEYNSSSLAVLLAKKYPSGLFAAVGLHPTNVLVGDAPGADADSEHKKEVFALQEYKELIKQSGNDVVAIGETGLDYYRLREGAEESIEAQKETFRLHLALAEDAHLPLIIHVRDKNNGREAHKDVLGILEEYSKEHRLHGGVIHSFSGTMEQARGYRSLGFRIAVNGIITFSRDYDAVVKDTPLELEDILLETDCPFLAPVPYRGKRNEPLYIVEVAKKLAALKNQEYNEVVRQTAQNAQELFTFA